MTDALTDDRARTDVDLADEVDGVVALDPESGSNGSTGSGDGGGFVRRHLQSAAEHLAGMPFEGYITLGVVLACVLFVFVQLGPANILSSSTPAGGDMGAHVWGPAYLRDNLLPQGRLTGWTPDWYAGFPAYQFYMVLPSLLIALLSFVLPYGVAFKLVAISGLVTLPISAWAFGRLTRLPFPIPPLLAVAATMFLFDRSFSILGGNIASTLAGEFAFSMSLSLALLYLGVVGRGLENGKHRGWAAILLALTALCHLIPLFFALAGTLVWFLLFMGWRRLPVVVAAGLAALSVLVGALLTTTDLWRTELYFEDAPASFVRFGVITAVVALVLFVPAVFVLDTLWTRNESGWSVALARVRWVVPVLVVGGALSAFWALPFYLRHQYMNDMGWEKKLDNRNLLFERARLDPQLVDSPPIKWLLAFAAVGALTAIVYLVMDRRRAGVFWLGMALVAAVGFTLAPQGRLWNARLLPFYYLALYALGAIGIGYIGRTVAMLVARDPNRPVRAISGAVAIGGAVVGLVVLALPLHAMPNYLGWPGHGIQLGQENGSSYKWWILPEVKDNSFVDSWARWNFQGYEGKPAYPEYHDIVETMDSLGQEQGCGRAMWEHEEEHNRYGTPMALMLLPFWTDGCIGSMEGLYFEASSTTPYHFINQDELSSAPSNAQRDLPYVPGAPSQTEFDLGVEHLQMLGVRYYMAISDRMIDFGRRNVDLTEVASSGPWVVFEVADSELVQSLDNQPAVMADLSDESHGWLDRSMDWYMDPNAWSVFLTDDGPSDWQRVARDEEPEFQPQTPVTVSNITTTNDSIEFDVSEPGTPILVKTSYFPNWKASGAEGPWRATPNLMVVVPTSNHVELHYGWTTVDFAGWGVTLAGLAGLLWFWKAGPIEMPVTPPRRRRGGTDDGGTPEGGAPDAGDGDSFGAATTTPSPDDRIPAAVFDPTDVILSPSPPHEPPPAPDPGRVG
jgi:hypothetical protein